MKKLLGIALLGVVMVTGGCSPSTILSLLMSFVFGGGGCSSCG